MKAALTVVGVVVAGRAGDCADQFVPKLRIQVCDGSGWTAVERAEGNDVFDGPTGPDEIQITFSQPATQCTALRLIPHESRSHVSMRADVVVAVASESDAKGVAVLSPTHAMEFGMAVPVAPDSHNFAHRAELCGLNTAAIPDHAHGWSPREATPRSTTYLQFTLVRPMLVHGVTTKGRGDYDGWTRSYAVEVTHRGSAWKRLTNAAGSTSFVGNTDRNTPVTNRLAAPVLADAVRIVPLECTNHCSMRADVLVTAAGDEALATKGERRAYEFGLCTVSSPDCHDENHQADLVSLSAAQVENHAHGWAPRAAVPGPYTYVQFTLKHPMQVHGVVTKGRGDVDCWLLNYAVEYSVRGSPWRRLRSGAGGEAFEANKDRDTEVFNRFDAAVEADAVRIVPLACQGHCGMRADILVSRSS